MKTRPRLPDVSHLLDLVGFASGRGPSLGEAVWGDTRVLLPEEEAGRSYRNIFTDEVIEGVPDGEGSGVHARDVFRHFPVALLVPAEDG